MNTLSFLRPKWASKKTKKLMLEIRKAYNSAKEHQETAKALIAEWNRIEAAHHAARAYEFAREAYDG